MGAGEGFGYRSEVLVALSEHGIHPRETTSPALVHEFVHDLYRYQLRRLRDQVRRRLLPTQVFAGQVAALRARYALVSLPLGRWTERPSDRPSRADCVSEDGS